MKTILLLLTSLLLISACSANKPAHGSNWFTKGEQAALRGLLPETIEILRQDAPLTEAQFLLYNAGYDKGLISFCDVEKAFNFGVRGRYYNGQCKGKLNHVQFNYEWERGFRSFMYR